MKLQLIQPGTGVYSSNSRSGCYPPLGLISIATHVRQRCPSVDVEILDGEHLAHAEIVARLDGDFVGLTTNTVNYPQAVEVARAAKHRGATVMVGGVYASAIPDIILSRRKDIMDWIVVGYGEEPVADLITGRLAGPSATYRVDGHVIRNLDPGFNHLAFPDRGLIPMEDYVRRFCENRPTWRSRGTNVFTNVGCAWRKPGVSGCIFCSRSGYRSARRHSDSIWREIRSLIRTYDVDYLVDFSDTILQDTNWLAALVESRPPDVCPTWHVFARVDEITPATVALLEKLPCNHIFVGVESGDVAMYRRTRKGGGSPADSLRVASLLTDHGIQLTPSYVVGLPGETPDSLRRTYDHACRLKEITGFEEVFCCELIPFPGSPAFDMLRQKVALETDMLDADELKRLWAMHFCTAKYNQICEYARRILDLGRYTITIARRTATVTLRHNTDKDSVDLPQELSRNDCNKHAEKCVTEEHLDCDHDLCGFANRFHITKAEC